MSDKTNNQAVAVSYGLLPVAFNLALVDSHRGATAVANSIIVEGRRTVALPPMLKSPAIAMSEPPIKSAFTPMQPTTPVKSLKPPANDATTAIKPPKPAREPTKTIQADVGIVLTTINDPTRRGLGVCYPHVTDLGAHEIVVGLSRACPLTARALAKADTALTKFITATLLVELALMRRGREADAIATALRLAVGVPSGRDLLGFSYLANLLADSALLESMDSLPLFGPLNTDNPGFHLITTLRGLEVLEPSALWCRKESECLKK